jgi:hypothetical protein
LRTATRVGCVIAACVAFLVAETPATSAARTAKARRGRGRLVVMARNIYLGADIGPAVFAIVNNPESIPQVLGQFFAEVKQTDIERRAEALADEILETRPDVIGLQEAAVWRTQFPSDGFGPAPTPAETVVFDFLKSLRRELRQRGLRYRTAVTATGVDVEFPTLRSDFQLEDVRLTVRDVILVRRGVRVRNRQAYNYDAAILLPFATGTLPLLRQWVSVDVPIRGRPGSKVRIISTHLEAGFRDSWLELHPDDPGKTGWQAPLLDNEESQLTHRIDYVLTRGDISATSAEIVGEASGDRIGGLWPSDHAGVVVELLVPRGRRR